MRSTCLAGLVLLVGWLGLPMPLAAQVERHELGRRLRAFEDAFDAEKDEAARKRAMTHMDRAVQGFFSGKMDVVGASLGRARFALRYADATAIPAAMQWADTVWLKPPSRFLDGAATHLELLLDQFYKTDAPMPADAVLHLALVPMMAEPGAAATGPAYQTTIETLPQAVRMPLPDLQPGDYWLRYEIQHEGQTLASGRSLLAVAAKRDERLRLLAEAVEQLDVKKNPDAATVRHLHQLLTWLRDGRTQETDYPAHRLLAEAETVLDAVQQGQPYYQGKRAGQFWLALPTARSTAVLRVMVPREAAQGKPLPLVLALHGAGGSENLFFDGYGNGKIVELCQQRGWLLAAPRGGFGRQSLPEIIDALAQRYPIDPKRVYVVGHSMGAGQALAAVAEQPQRYAAIAALGGGGRIRAQGVEHVPFFLGIGTKDFAYNSVRALRTALTRAGVQHVAYKEYPDIEHMVIVQVALPDVFTFFAQAKPAP